MEKTKRKGKIGREWSNKMFKNSSKSCVHFQLKYHNQRGEEVDEDEPFPLSLNNVQLGNGTDNYWSVPLFFFLPVSTIFLGLCTYLPSLLLLSVRVISLPYYYSLCQPTCNLPTYQPTCNLPATYLPTYQPTNLPTYLPILPTLPTYLPFLFFCLLAFLFPFCHFCNCSSWVRGPNFRSKVIVVVGK